MKHTAREVKLKNGAKGLLVNVSSSNVISLVAGFNAGFSFADPQLPELPHLMEHLVVGANSRYPTMKDFEAAVERNGAANNAFTSQYFLGYEMECAAFEFERILELLAVEIASPAFKPIEIAAEVGNVREELNRNLTEYGRVAYDVLNRHTLGRHTMQQSLASLDKTTRDDIVAYYRNTHTSNNLRFIFAGPVAKQRPLIRRLDKWLGEMTKGRRLAIPDENPKHLAEPVLIKKDIPQLYYRFSQYAAALPSKEEAVLDVLGIILTDRYKSWILGEARDRGLAYWVTADSRSGPNYSSFSISPYTTPANSLELFRLIAEQLRRAVRGDFDPVEIEEAKQLLIGRRLRQYKTPAHLVHWYFQDYFTYERINEFDSALEEVKAVTDADLQRVTSQLFAKPRWGLSLVGDISPAHAKRLHKELSRIWQS